MELSYDNMLADANITLTPSSADATYTAANLRTPQRPFLPWRTTALGAQNVVVDFLAARKVTALLLTHVNMTSVTIQGNATDSWGAPSFSQALTIRRNPWNGRYQHGVILSGFNFRFMRVLIPSQSVINGVAYYSIGGLWLGTINSTPRPHHWRVDYRVIEPRLETQPAHRGWRQRLKMGEPLTSVTLSLAARVNERRPGDNDQLRDWLEIERRQRDADYFVLFPISDEPLIIPDPSQIIVSRNVAALQWRMQDLGLATAQWELEEVVST